MINCYSVHFIKLIVMTFHLFIICCFTLWISLKENFKSETAAEGNDAQMYITDVNLGLFWFALPECSISQLGGIGGCLLFSPLC